MSSPSSSPLSFWLSLSPCFPLSYSPLTLFGLSHLFCLFPSTLSLCLFSLSLSFRLSYVSPLSFPVCSALFFFSPSVFIACYYLQCGDEIETCLVEV
jgi:hypothetical protein